MQARPPTTARNPPPNEGQIAPTRREMLLRTNKPPQAWFFLMFRFVRSHRGLGPRIGVALRSGEGWRFAAARLVSRGIVNDQHADWFFRTH